MDKRQAVKLHFAGQREMETSDVALSRMVVQSLEQMLELLTITNDRIAALERILLEDACSTLSKSESQDQS